jgi:ethanolamine-phosphate phospho-lyase
MFQHHGVVPDIVTIGKPMGNGYPMAAVICKRPIADCFAASGVEYFNTFGGNSVACYIGDAVLDVIEQEGLQAQALRVGALLVDRIRSLQHELVTLGTPYIGDVRAAGLFVGVEIVCNCCGHPLPSAPEDQSRLILESFDLDQACDLTQALVLHMQLHQQIISSRDENVFKIKPPLVFSDLEAELLVSSFREAIMCFIAEQHVNA